MRQAVDAALEMIRYYPQCQFSDPPKLRIGYDVGPDDLREAIAFFLGAAQIIRPKETVAAQKEKDGAETLPVQQNTTATTVVRYANQVPWNDADPAYYRNRDAIKDAKNVGRDHELESLSALDYIKIKALSATRQPAQCISCLRKGPSGARSTRRIAGRYLDSEVKRDQCIRISAENLFRANEKIFDQKKD